MQKIFQFVNVRKKSLVFLLLIAVVVVFFITKDAPAPVWTIDTVSVGTVRHVVSVSGSVDAVGSADLAFPTSGIVESIAISEGAEVKQGDTLATLAHADLKADRKNAEAALLIAKANRTELINGQSSEELEVSKTTAEIAREELSRITNEQNDRVKNAYRTLLSSDLVAKPENSNNRDVAPIITGTYTCAEGVYTLDVYSSSNAYSGYSYRLGGLETGTYTAYTKSSAPMGTCGLRIQFDEDETYASSRWLVTIPNIESSAYITNSNAYNIALTQRTNAIRAAEQNLTLAEQNLLLDTALPRSEELARKNAEILQAEARLSVVNAQIQDHVLTAPFDGVVTNIEALVGETVTTAPVVTLVSQNAYELTALIPEIDIIKIAPGQHAEVVFDARRNDILPATITFISPLAKEVDGVSYFEAKLMLDGDTAWLRSGLNADVDIIIESREDVLRLPKRYVIEKDGHTNVLIPRGEATTSVPIDVIFTGNDGYVEVSGLAEGATVIAP